MLESLDQSVLPLIARSLYTVVEFLVTLNCIWLEFACESRVRKKERRVNDADSAKLKKKKKY